MTQIATFNYLVYSLGQRDAVAAILMKRKFDGSKDPQLAAQYRDLWGEHPTLTFHLS